ncbi:MAG TPA: winged helix-turn-helix domain-containing protein [Candidatus Thermoplasmatota archaeon]
MWKRVILTPRIFAALASPVRVRVLRVLEEHQMTGTEVASRLAMSKSTAFKELSRLEGAGLTARVEGNRKWVYYRLTETARRILHPEDVILTFSPEFDAPRAGAKLAPAVGPAPSDAP